MNPDIIYYGNDAQKISRLKPKMKERALQLVSLEEKCKQNIETQFLQEVSEFEASIFLKQADAKLNTNDYYRFDHSQAIGLIEKKIADLQSKIDADIPVLQSRKEKILIEEQKTRAVIAAFYGKTRDEAARLKSQLEITENCPYCNMPLEDNCQADHIYPVSKGGLSTVENMVYVCYGCNQRKSNLTLTQFIKKFSLDKNTIEKQLETLGKEIP